MRPGPHRRGFTLLEVTLALSVGVLLLGGLYVAVEVQLRHARDGRRVVEQATLARSLLARIDADVAACGTLIDPERFRMAGSSSSGASTPSSGSTGTSAPSTGGTSGGSGTSPGSGASSGSGGSTGGSSVADNVVLPLSVQGDSETLNLFIARVPREAIPSDPNAVPQLASDLRRVSWWLPGGGLARQEVPVETSADALENLPPGIPDEDTYVVAPEVKSVQFQYWDGSDWQDSWDCTAAGADGVTPVGPPQAIAITLEIATPHDDDKDGDPPTKQYRHVVACLTANGTTPQQPAGTAQQNGTGGNAAGRTGP